MPGFDGSGPMGAGPMTGGARGNCNPVNVGHPTDGYFGFGSGMAYGRGFRGGYGFSCAVGRRFTREVPMYPQAYSGNPADELTLLKQQANIIKDTIDSISQRIDEIENAE